MTAQSVIMSVPPHGGAVVRQGHLRKLKTMKRKFFVLRSEDPSSSARLEYYESEKKFKSGAAPRRVIPLKSCFNVSRRLDLKQKYVIMLCTKEEQFCVVADGEEDLHSWFSDILRQHQSQASEELLHPTQHVWQVNVQKKGLGASKNIIGLYNLCLTDKTLSLVKIKANNNVISEYAIPEKVEYSLRNIRRCGDSECFFYMEVGRQTTTGAGELWMHTDDSNIAQSMHSTIYHAMSNCREEIQPLTRNRSSSANEDPRQPNAQPARRSTYSDSRGRAGLTNANENQHSNLTDETNDQNNQHRMVTNQTRSFYSEPLRIVHERTKSAPLAGDESDHVEKPVRHSSCRSVHVNGMDGSKKGQWSRRASTGTRFMKLSSSPAHSKNVPSIRNRCDSMPSRTCPPMDNERTPSRHAVDHVDGISPCGDGMDVGGGGGVSEWLRSARIPEEPDYCEMNSREQTTTASIHHSRNSSLVGVDEGGYLPMLPTLSASSGSVSGTPSTDPRFSEYQLEPATSHILDDDDERPPRAYSVGSRPCSRQPELARLRAYSVGARTKARPLNPHHPPPHHNSNSAPLLPRNSTEDLMELDFSNNSPKTKVTVAKVHTPKPKPKVDEYVSMSSPKSGYVEMRPSDILNSVATSTPNAKSTPIKVVMAKSPSKPVATKDGYVEMNCGKMSEKNSRPITITSTLQPNMINAEFNKAEEPKKKRNNGDDTPDTPLSSQTLFELSLESPASQEDKDFDNHDVFGDEITHHPLTTVREISEEGKKSPEIGSPPHYITLPKTVSQPIAAPLKLNSESDGDELSSNPTATKTWAGDNTRFEERKSTSPAPEVNNQVNYVTLDLEPSGGKANVTSTTYTRIDFGRSEKLNASDNN